MCFGKNSSTKVLLLRLCVCQVYIFIHIHTPCIPCACVTLTEFSLSVREGLHHCPVQADTACDRAEE